VNEVHDQLFSLLAGTRNGMGPKPQNQWANIRVRSNDLRLVHPAEAVVFHHV